MHVKICRTKAFTYAFTVKAINDRYTRELIMYNRDNLSAYIYLQLGSSTYIRTRKTKYADVKAIQIYKWYAL